VLCVQVTRAVKKELYAMKQLSHDNMSRLIGACIEPGRVCIVTPYCSRGSLRASISTFVYLSYCGDSDTLPLTSPRISPLATPDVPPDISSLATTTST